jgi:hypothetical protein
MFKAEVAERWQYSHLQSGRQVDRARGGDGLAARLPLPRPEERSEDRVRTTGAGAHLTDVVDDAESRMLDDFDGVLCQCLSYTRGPLAVERAHVVGVMNLGRADLLDKPGKLHFRRAVAQAQAAAAFLQ